MTKSWSLMLTGLVVLAIAAALGWLYREKLNTPDLDEEKEAAIQRPSSVTKTGEGETGVRLDEESQLRIGLKTVQLTRVTEQRQLVAYGILLEDPSETFELRAPAAGVVHSSEERSWPGLGERLAGGVMGFIQVRLTQMDRLSVEERLSSVRAELKASSAAAEAASAALRRARALNADNKNVSDRALEEAGARFTAEEARLAAARRTAELLEGSAQSASGAPGPPLTVTRGGEVTEILARPGESVESGQVLLRLNGFSRLIARVAAPAGETIPPVATARIVAFGQADGGLRGVRLSRAPAIDPKTQGQAVFFRVENQHGELRPGLAITAYLSLPLPASDGVAVPFEAVVRAAGRAWAYVETSQGLFVRRDVQTDMPVDSGWFVTRNFAPGDRVVASATQILLSEEMKSQIQVGEESNK